VRQWTLRYPWDLKRDNGHYASEMRSDARTNLGIAGEQTCPKLIGLDGFLPNLLSQSEYVCQKRGGRNLGISREDLSELGTVSMLGNEPSRRSLVHPFADCVRAF
jgi:hypothetical protein